MTRRNKGKTALVLAGGGIMGAAYEIGVLTALDQLFADDFSTNRFDVYVGVSAGSVIATLVANQIPPAALFQAISNDERTVFNWKRRDIYRFEWRAVLAGLAKLAGNCFRVFRSYRRPGSNFSRHDLFYLLQEQFPSGLFSLQPMQQYLCRAFQQEGICDDFHALTRELYIPAYDLDSGRRVVFGEAGHRDVHICQAITASCAIPYFFRPHKIGGRYYLDGNTGRVTHIDLAIRQGAKLIVLVNPRVPMNNDPERTCLPSLSYGQCASIADLGISYAWEQSQRIENQEKLAMALAGYRREYPDVEILVLEPGPEESLLFFQSPMSQVARTHIMHYGYHLTLGQLKSRFAEFSRAFLHKGIEVTEHNLQDAFLDLPVGGT
jgi:NTE family protein